MTIDNEAKLAALEAPLAEQLDNRGKAEAKKVEKALSEYEGEAAELKEKQQLLGL